MFRGCARRKLILVAFAVVLTFAESATSQHATAQEPKIPAVSEETYYKVLDLLFPRDVLQDHTLHYVFVLRYEPTFYAESQLIIMERWGKTEVVEYESLDGSIEMKLNELVRRTGIEDAVQMAKQIRIEKRDIKMSHSDIGILHRQFFERLRLSERRLLRSRPDNVEVTLDGTTYRLWYSGIVDIQSEFSGSGLKVPPRRDEPPLIGWMKNVYRKTAFFSN